MAASPAATPTWSPPPPVFVLRPTAPASVTEPVPPKMTSVLTSPLAAVSVSAPDPLNVNVPVVPAIAFRLHPIVATAALVVTKLETIPLLSFARRMPWPLSV